MMSKAIRFGGYAVISRWVVIIVKEAMLGKPVAM